MGMSKKLVDTPYEDIAVRDDRAVVKMDWDLIPEMKMVDRIILQGFDFPIVPMPEGFSGRCLVCNRVNCRDCDDSDYHDERNNQ